MGELITNVRIWDDGSSSNILNLKFNERQSLFEIGAIFARLKTIDSMASFLSSALYLSQPTGPIDFFLSLVTYFSFTSLSNPSKLKSHLISGLQEKSWDRPK
jgi:hypothetical protein